MPNRDRGGRWERTDLVLEQLSVGAAGLFLPSLRFPILFVRLIELLVGRQIFKFPEMFRSEWFSDAVLLAQPFAKIDEAAAL